MSFDAMTWASRQDPGEPIAKLILIGLGRHANGSGLAWPSVAELAEYSGLERKSVLRRLAKLERAGMISDSGQRRGDTGRVKVWRLAMDQPYLSLPKSSRKGAHLNRGKQSRTKGPLGADNGPSTGIIPEGGLLDPKQSSFPAGSSDNGPSTAMIPVEARNGPSTGTRNKSEKNKSHKSGDLKTGGQAGAENQRRIFEAWNSMASGHGLPMAQSLTADRKAKLAKRLKEHGPETILAAIARIPNSDFLMGNNDRGWKASFDFILIPARLNRLVEGGYSESQPHKANGGKRPEPKSMTETILAEMEAERAHHAK